MLRRPATRAGADADDAGDEALLGGEVVDGDQPVSRVLSLG
jgi:hypothetical protein